MNTLKELNDLIINNDYCIGCGACAYLNNDSIKMIKNNNGQIQAFINQDSFKEDLVEYDVCPFTNQSYKT